MNQQAFRSQVLTSYGAKNSELTELLDYNRNVFDLRRIEDADNSSPDRPQLSLWRQTLETGKTTGIFQALRSILVQLQFPIRSGISQTKLYREATLKGQTASMHNVRGLELLQPDRLQLIIHPTRAGAIPVLLPGNRDDFVALVRALTKKNEPKPVPDSMGACMVANYNNWGLIDRYRQQWRVKNSDRCSARDWQLEFRRLIPQKHLYQDHFIILSRGFYSGLSPQSMKLSEAEWQRLSLNIRLEHECTHYFTYRVLGSMRNNLLDELIADYQGIVSAIGYYRADWFLRFMGLESFPNYRSGGRFENYLGKPPLSEMAVKILQQLVVAAAQNLEYFDRHYLKAESRDRVLLALTSLTLEELASTMACERIEQSLERLVCV